MALRRCMDLIWCTPRKEGANQDLGGWALYLVWCPQVELIFSNFYMEGAMARGRPWGYKRDPMAHSFTTQAPQEQYISPILCHNAIVIFWRDPGIVLSRLCHSMRTLCCDLRVCSCVTACLLLCVFFLSLLLLLNCNSIKLCTTTRDSNLLRFIEGIDIVIRKTVAIKLIVWSLESGWVQPMSIVTP